MPSSSLDEIRVEVGVDVNSADLIYGNSEG